MSMCLVTGKETQDKWKGHPVCREAREIAKTMLLDEKYADMGMRNVLILLSKRFQKSLITKLETMTKEAESSAAVN